MFNSQFDKTLLESHLGLSCIEDYIIYLYRQQFSDYNHLFFNSHLSLHQIIKEFKTNGASITSFYGVERLQQTLNEKNLMCVRYVEGDEIKFSDKVNYIAISVSSDFMIQKYKRRLERNDHYLLINTLVGKEDFFSYLNSIPKDVGILEKKVLKKIFIDSYFEFSNVTQMNCEQKEEFLKIYLKLLHESEDFKINDECKMDVVMFRDFIGILRILRKRDKKYCDSFIDVSFMNDYLLLLDNIYISAEYIRLRNTYSIEKFMEFMKTVIKRDYEVITTLIQKMENFVYV